MSSLNEYLDEYNILDHNASLFDIIIHTVSNINNADISYSVLY